MQPQRRPVEPTTLSFASASRLSCATRLTDGLPGSKGFKTLSIRKVDELVGYKLEGHKAPSLALHAGNHLTADKYHEMLKAEDGVETVVIDVRNRYESTIGHFQPPPGGAELLDPLMRNSKDFAPWPVAVFYLPAFGPSSPPPPPPCDACPPRDHAHPLAATNASLLRTSG